MPSRPVRPEMTSLVSSPTMMLMTDSALASSTTFSAAPSIVFSTCRFGEVGVGEQAEPLLGVGAVEPDDQRHADVDLLRGLDDALGDLVAAGDAAEDVEEDRDDLLVGGDHLERVDDRLGLGAAAGVEEVGGLAAGLRDHVEGRHAEPGAVAEDADVAVELHVGEALLLRHPLLRVLDEALLEVGEVLVAEERGVVDRHLGVEGDHVAVLGHDQRVDLDQGRVALVEGGVELHQHLGGLLAGVLGDAGVGDQRGGLGLAEALAGLDVAADQRVRVLLGDLLDVHAAHRREHRQQLLGGAVEDDRGVVLGLDVGGPLDPHLVDGERPLAARPADVHAEDRVGVLLGLGLVLRRP